MSEIIEVARAAALEAGTFLKDNFGSVLNVEVKEDRSLATNIDKGAEDIVMRHIEHAFPSHSIMGEESGEHAHDSDYLWIIDPLDGTHNYIHGMDCFGVSIGIMNADEFVGGVIYMPLQDELYVAEKGSGAYKNDAPISVSHVAELSAAFVSYDSSMRTVPDEYFRALARVGRSVFSVRMVGSSVRILTYLAEGKLDATVEFQDKPWDFAGGVCLIEEAGGVIEALDGKKLGARSLGYIGSNGHLHDALRAVYAGHV